MTISEAQTLVGRYRDSIEAIEDLRAMTRVGRVGWTTEQPEYRALAELRDAAHRALLEALTA